MIRSVFLLFCFLFFVFSCKKHNNDKSLAHIENLETTQNIKKDHQVREIIKAEITPSVDGNMDDPAWQKATWYPMDQIWIGEHPTFEDFFGRYKITWTPEALYVLVEVKDDTLFDQYDDPLQLWWDDDCVEIFIDADNSGGNHQFNNNAFAYHVALDGNVVDLASDKKPVLYNNHVVTKRITKKDISIWEFEIIVYDETYQEGKTNDAIILKKGHKLGFAIAYNDNDGSKERENFMGSVFIPGEEKNLGWINADVFGTILLIE